MKNIRAISVVVLLLLSGIIFPIVSSNEITTNNILYVDDVPSEGPDNPPEDYTIIQYAIDNASDGDTIYVYNGTYSECLIITKEVCLIGEDNTNTILQSVKPEDITQFNRIIEIYADNVQVKNFFIRPYNNSATYYVIAIFAEDSKKLIIQNNQFINCRNGILLCTNSSGEILDNHIQNYLGIPPRCISFYKPIKNSTIVISRNSIIRYGNGIAFLLSETAPSKIIIDHNHIESKFGQHSANNFDSGISFSHTVDTNYDLIISHNNITGFTFGIYYSGGGLPLDNSSVYIFLNTFNNEKSDLYLLPNPMRSNLTLFITNNNFLGDNKQELFIEMIILDPFMIPLYLKSSIGLTHKNSIVWTSNYWHYHNTLLPKLIPGKMLIYFIVPFFAVDFNIFQIDASPVNTPYDISC